MGRPKDDLDEMIARRTRKNQEFPKLLAKATKALRERRARERAKKKASG